jgi:hypothetical protein
MAGQERRAQVADPQQREAHAGLIQAETTACTDESSSNQRRSGDGENPKAQIWSPRPAPRSKLQGKKPENLP